jgi:hypothetical protein
MLPTNQRPKSLHEVAERATSLEAWGAALSDFLDEINFRRAADISLGPCVQPVPKLLRAKFSGGEIADAFSAAVAEYFATESLGGTAPAWTRQPERFLDIPWYPDDSPQIRAYLDRVAPREFREHGVFIDIDSLARV